MGHTVDFRHLYDYPPISTNKAQGNRGSSATASFHPINPPRARNTPRHIVEDANIGLALLNFARAYLQTNTVVPSSLLLTALTLMADKAHATTNSTELNVQNLFGDVVAYGHMFVEEADALPTGSVALAGCPTRHGIHPGGRSIRQGATRVMFEYKGRRALDAHADGITSLATANSGMGTELIRSPGETDSRSIVFNLSCYMAMEDCPWAILFGMDYFFIFFLNKVYHGDDIYHHIHCSPQLPAFHNGRQQNPSIFQAFIAMLLGEPSQALAHKYSPTVSVPIGQRYPECKGGTGPKYPTQGRSNNTADPGTRKMDACSSMANLHIPSLKSIALSSPASDAPERNIILDRFRSRTAHQNGLRLHNPSRATGPEESAHIFLGEELGCGVTGSVAQGQMQCKDSGQQQRVAVKLMEKDMVTFYSEAESYDRLQGKPFCPSFYGAFVGNGPSGAEFGAVVIEELPQTFEDEEDMTTQQRSQAFQCLLELHRMGIHHGDIGSPCFGLNSSGEVVVYDFSHSKLFDNCDIEKCSEIKTARQFLFSE